MTDKYGKQTKQSARNWFGVKIEDLFSDFKVYLNKGKFNHNKIIIYYSVN